MAEQWQALPFDEASFLGDVGLSVPAGEADRSVLEKIWSRPTCDVNGIIGGYTGQRVEDRAAGAGQRQGVVPARRQAEPRQGRRGVPGLRARRACRPTARSSSSRTARARRCSCPSSSEALTRARRALQAEWGKEPVLAAPAARSRSSASFKQDLKMDALMIGFALDDDRIHSPNEKYN